MSLLAQVNQPNANRYYFALDTTPADPTVTAPAFEAIGTAPAPVGTFSAQGDGVPGGIDMFNMKTSLGRLQWSIGMNGAAAGANSGNDLAIFGYDDNGAFLNGPLQIQRSTGNVIITEPLATVEIAAGGNVAVAGNISATGDISSNTAGIASALTVGTAATVGGGALEVNGTLGVSTVYDPVYNKPYGAEVLLATFDATGANTGSFPFTAAKSGLYCLTLSTSVSATGLGWTNGVTAFAAYAVLAGGGGTPSDSYMVVDSMATPAMTIVPIGAPNYYIKDQMAITNLNAGEQITAAVQTQGGMNLGTQGGISVFVQPLIA